jgi:hypothetical protein
MGKTMNNMDDYKKTPFTVPENFFEQFNQEIMLKLPRKKGRRIHTNFKKYILPWVAVAAVLSGVLFSVKDTIFKSDETSSKSVNGMKNEDFASSEDRDFYLFIQDETDRKELTGYYSE